MFKFMKLGSIILATTLLSNCGAKTKTEIPYLEMTEAEQDIALKKHAKIFEKSNAKILGQENSSLKIEFKVDAKEDMIHMIGIYPKRVSAEDLKKIKPIAARAQANIRMCPHPDTIALNALGIGVSMRMVDLSGQTLYQGDVCRGVKDTLKLRGPSAAR